MIIGIDHGFSAVKTKHFVFTAGIVSYDNEPFTMQNVLEYEGRYYVCGTGRQPLIREKMSTPNYFLLTLAAVAKEIKYRGKNSTNSVILAAGLPLTGYGRDKKPFREYLLHSSQSVDGLSPIKFKFEGEPYEITIEDVKLFPQGYSAIAVHPELLAGEPSVLLCDIGGWTVDLMRIDNNVPNAGTCRSLELGVIRCIDEILEQVRRSTGLSLSDAQVERILAGQQCSMDEKAREIVQEQGRRYTEGLLSAILEAGFDCKAMPVIFMGGGAKIMEQNVSPCVGLCKPIFLTDTRANAEGFERIVGQMWAK